MIRLKLSARFLIYCMIGFLLIVVFFGDFIKFPVGLYAARRFSLIFIYLFFLNLYFFLFAFSWSGVIRLQIFAFKESKIALGGLFIFFASGIISQFYASGVWSWVEFLYYFLYFCSVVFLSILFVVFCDGSSFLSYRKVVPLLMVIGGFFYAILTIPIYFYAISDKFLDFISVMPWGFVNIRYWSHVATWLIPLLPLAALIEPVRWKRLWQCCVWVTASVWWWLIFLSAARGTMCALFISGLIVFFVFGRAAKKWISMSLKYAASGFFLWLILTILVPYVLFGSQNIPGVDLSSSGRLPLWKEAFAMSLQHFPLGMGAQSWLTHKTLTKAYAISVHFAHPHNMYLMWAAEYGWLSILGILLAAYGLGIRLFKKARVQQSFESFDGIALVSLAGSVVAGAIHASVSAIFIAPASMIIGFVVLSMFVAELFIPLPKTGALGSSAFEWQRKSVRSQRNKIRLGIFVLVFSGSMLWLYGVFAYYQAMRADIPFYQGHVKQSMEPRFWFHGNFPRQPKLMPPPQTD